MSCKSRWLEKCPWVNVVVTSTTHYKCIPKFDCVGAYQNGFKTFMGLHNKSHLVLKMAISGKSFMLDYDPLTTNEKEILPSTKTK